MKKIIYLILAICIGLTSACQTDDYATNTDPANESGIELLSDGRLKVPLQLFIPERTNVEVVATKQWLEKEKQINNIAALVFDKNTGSKLQYVVGQKDGSQLYAVLAPYSSPCSVYLVANVSADVDLEGVSSIDDLLALKEQSAILSSDALPMATKAIELNDISISSLTGKIFNLNFSYARIDLSSKVEIADFRIFGVTVLNAPKQGYIVPQTTLPVDLGGEEKGVEIAVPEIGAVSGIYLFPNSGKSAVDQPQGSNFTDIIIKGLKSGFALGYYKLRIKYTSQGVNSFDIASNKCYKIQIEKVSGPGYTSFDEAINNQPSNIEYDLTIDDPESSDITVSNGGYYLGLSNSEYIIYADQARGVVAATLSFKVPSTVTNAQINITGNGLTLSANQPGLSVSLDGLSATISGLDNTLKTIPVRINIAGAASTGSVKFRIGDIVKELKVIRKDYLSETIQNKISLSDLGLSDYSVIESQSDRIVVNADKSLTVNPEEGPSMRVLSSVKCLASGSRGNIVIAVKRKIVNAVYFEKYTDGKYGLFLTKNIPATLDNADRVIEQAGYGVVDTESPATKSVTIGASAFNNVLGESSRDLFEDYEGVVYRVNQQSLTALTTIDKANQLKFNGVNTKAYVFPNFAKGVYYDLKALATQTQINITDGVTSASAFVIRTPKQLSNVNSIVTLTQKKFFAQEKDLDFTKTNVGGSATALNKSFVSGVFKGQYEGNNRVLSGLSVISTGNDIGLFQQVTGGVFRNLSIKSFNIKGSTYVGSLAGQFTPPVTMDNIRLIDSKVEGTYKFTGGLIGQSLGTTTSPSLLSNINIINSTIKDQWCVGGIVGYCQHGEQTTEYKFLNCNTDKNTTIQAKSGDHGLGAANGVGGIVGVAYDGKFYLINCVNRATVEATEYALAGGMVGDFDGPDNATYENRSLLKGCINHGTIISGTQPFVFDRTVGGLIGDIWRFVNIHDCENHGTINAKQHSAGGIIGHFWYEVEMKNCKNYGTITSTMTLASQGTVAGIAGWIEGDINNVIDNCHNYADININGSKIAGIVGSTTGTSQVKNCTNNGSIKGMNYVGGIVGYALGTVTGSSNSKNIKGTDYVGGIVGYACNIVSNCLVYNKTATEPAVSGVNRVGGITGEAGNVVRDVCVIDTQTNPSISFVSGTGLYIGGIAGVGVYINQSLFLAKSFVKDSKLYPITGYGTVPEATNYFLLSASFNTTILGGGTRHTTDQLKVTPNVTVTPWSTSWIRVPANENYPYPKLSKFNTPTEYPVVN